jgi:hypothetical protein
MAAERERVLKRLGSYWKMEAVNVVGLPAFLCWMASKYGGVGWASGLALGAVAFLLVIGTAYWHAKNRQLRAKPGLQKTLRYLARLRLPALLWTSAAIAAAAVVQLRPDLAAGAGDRWVALAAAILAALEYVNYYHRQLQHFDNVADIKRLVTGRGFRRSQMARDLERYS